MWKLEVVKDPDAGWRWRLVLRNTVIVFESSERFDRRLDAKHAAEITRVELGKADVVVL